MKTFEITLDIPAREAWTAIGEKFGETGQWTSALDSSHMIGDVAEGGHRVCIQGQKTLTEKVINYDNENMSLEYELVEGRPAIVESAFNNWSVKSTGPDTCLVTMRPVTKLKWWALPMTPVLAIGLNSILPKVLEEFKHWAETSEVHPKKLAHDTKLQASQKRTH